MLVTNWCSVELVVHVGLLLELGWRALVGVVVVVAVVWLSNTVGLEAATELVPVDGWLTTEASSHIIMVVSTSVVHWLTVKAHAGHHAVFHWWEPLLVP